MSRSKNLAFADFFPTAPSVLQQKKSKSAHQRKRQDPTSVHDAINAPSSSKASPTAFEGGGSQRPSVHGNGDVDHTMPDATPIIHDETESTPGDILNGVGSASSTSTTSSVFSTHNRPVDAAHRRGNLNATLTPLTNESSSPPSTSKSPAHLKQEAHANSERRGASNTSTTHEPPPQNPVAPFPDVELPQARPARGLKKGIKVVYDPELDKSLNSKEKRGKKAEYKEIVDDVRILKTDNILRTLT